MFSCCFRITWSLCGSMENVSILFPYIFKAVREAGVHMTERQLTGRCSDGHVNSWYNQGGSCSHLYSSFLTNAISNFLLLPMVYPTGRLGTLQWAEIRGTQNRKAGVHRMAKQGHGTKERVHHFKPVLNIRKGEERWPPHTQTAPPPVIIPACWRLLPAHHIYNANVGNTAHRGVRLPEQGSSRGQTLPSSHHQTRGTSLIYTHTPGQPHLDSISSRKHLGTRLRDHFVNDILTFIIKSYSVRVKLVIGLRGTRTANFTQRWLARRFVNNVLPDSKSLLAYSMTYYVVANILFTIPTQSIHLLNKLLLYSKTNCSPTD